MSAKAKARFAVGFGLAILIVTVFICLFVSFRSMADEVGPFAVVTTQGPPCGAGFSGFGIDIHWDCTRTEKHCVASESGTFCTRADCEKSIE